VDCGQAKTLQCFFFLSVCLVVCVLIVVVVGFKTIFFFSDNFFLEEEEETIFTQIKENKRFETINCLVKKELPALMVHSDALPDKRGKKVEEKKNKTKTEPDLFLLLAVNSFSRPLCWSAQPRISPDRNVF
jgi:hypothetical protein